MFTLHSKDIVFVIKITYCGGISCVNELPVDRSFIYVADTTKISNCKCLIS